MTTEPDYQERLEKLLMFKEKLGAQEKELSRLLTRLEDTEVKRAAVSKEIGNNLSTQQRVEESPQEMSKLMTAINYLPDVESIVKCEICGKLYISGNCHECPEVDK
jgi:seryl-tRNA synthetase